MSSAARSIRRVRTRRGAVLSRNITPHTLAVTDGYLFVLGRNQAENFRIRIPMRAIRQLLSLPRGHVVDPGVLDVDPDTTDYTYSGKLPEFLLAEDDGEPSTEEA